MFSRFYVSAFLDDIEEEAKKKCSMAVKRVRIFRHTLHGLYNNLFQLTENSLKTSTFDAVVINSIHLNAISIGSVANELCFIGIFAFAI